MPKGAIGSLAAHQRRDFLRDKLFVPGARLSAEKDAVTVLDEKTVAASNWLPGTIEAVYETSGSLTEITRQVAMKEHVAGRFSAHPAGVKVRGEHVIDPALPLNPIPLRVAQDGATVSVVDNGPAELDVSEIRKDWQRRLGISDGPVDSLYFSIVERFINQLVIADPAALDQVRGQPCLFVGNHQVAVESLIFSIVASALHGKQIMTLAKKEHRSSWLGRLIGICEDYPDIELPRAITFVDREDQASVLDLGDRIEQDLRNDNSSLMVHVEGTRSRHCRNPVTQIGGVFLDLAVNANIPIVPIRFAGGLPVAADADATRLEFPHRYARQDIHIGSPIQPDELSTLPLVAQKARVLAAINDLGPDHSSETPNAPDDEFAAAVQGLMTDKGLKEPQAVILQAIQNVGYSDDALAKVCDHIIRGAALADGSPNELWLKQLAKWFMS